MITARTIAEMTDMAVMASPMTSPPIARPRPCSPVLVFCSWTRCPNTIPNAARTRLETSPVIANPFVGDGGAPAAGCGGPELVTRADGGTHPDAQVALVGFA
jgi:hypothetical protein